MHAVILIAVSALVTILLRFLPFWVLQGKSTPMVIVYLGRVLPAAIMGMLVVYCLKDINVTVFPFGAAELIAAAVTAGLHVWKRNTLISIICGTLVYMILVQTVLV